MEEFYRDGEDIVCSKFEFTPSSDVSDRIVFSVMEEASRLEAQYARSPQYLIVGVAEQMAIRAECMTRNRYDAGDVTNFYGLTIIPVPLELFCQLAFDDASFVRMIYFRKRDKKSV